MLESPCLSQETGRWDPRTDYRCFAGCFRARAPALMKPDADSTVRVRDSQQPGLDSPEQGPHAPEEEDSQRPARAYSLPILRPQLEDLVERDLCRDLSPR